MTDHDRLLDYLDGLGFIAALCVTVVASASTWNAIPAYPATGFLVGSAVLILVTTILRYYFERYA